MKDIKTFKEYRLTEDNKQEVIMVEEFKKHVKDGYIPDQIVFGTKEGTSSTPNQYLTDREKQVMLSTLQWLGSHVGQCYLRDCGLLNEFKY